MQDRDVEPGLSVKVTELKEAYTKAFFVRKQYLQARRLGAVGVVHSYVSGHGGDVWWVRHEDGSVAVYMFDEFEPV